MVALALVGGCSGQARHAPAPGPVVVAVAPTPPPVVHFRLQIIRDWDSPFFVVAEEDHDFTLQEAVAFGLPAELWIRFLVSGPADMRFSIFWVRPSHA